MKVLHVIDGLGTGGAERSLAEMLPLLPRHGVDSVVAVFHHRPEGVETAVVRQGARIRSLAEARGPSALRALRRVIMQEQPDLIHTSIFHADVAGRLAAVGSGFPVATSLVNMSYGPERRLDPNVVAWKLRTVQAVDGFTARHLAGSFHAITQVVADSAIRTLGIDPQAVTVIPRGRDRSRLGHWSRQRREDVRTRLGVEPDAALILNVGRREFQKDQATLVRAMPAVLRQHPDAILLVAGRDGNASRQLDALVADLGLQEVVRFLGHTDQVPDLLVAADVFAFPSRYEGLGGSVLEAMAMRAPVVASNIAPMREVLRGGSLGSLFSPGDDRELAYRVDEVLAGKIDLERQVAAALMEFESQYELEPVTAQMAAWFQSAAART